MWDREQWRRWRLVVKLDPDKTLPGRSLDLLNDQAIDAVVVGGTQGINTRNTAELVRLVRQSGFSGPLVQEISSVDAIVLDVDAYLLPVVLNAGDKRWLVDAHLQAVKRYRALIPWDRVLTEGYIICNRDSAAGRLTGVGDVGIEDAVGYTVLAEEVFGIPVVYIEYSGVFGNMELLRAVSRVRKRAHLFYGGGIISPEQLRAVAEFADTVVIGNLLYDDPDRAREVLGSGFRPRS